MSVKRDMALLYLSYRASSRQRNVIRQISSWYKTAERHTGFTKLDLRLTVRRQINRQFTRLTFNGLKEYKFRPWTVGA